MDFSQVFIPRAEFRDFRKGLASQHCHSEVVIIDRSPTGAAHQVYQLKAEYMNFCDNLSYLRQEFQRLDHDAFIVMGELQEVAMAKKVIVLTNGNVITYKYLILFNGNEQPIELETALHALKDALLIDAINIKDKLKVALSPYTPFGISMPNETPSHTYSSNQDSNSIDKVAQPLMQQQGDSLSIDIGANARSLCQVQI